MRYLILTFIVWFSLPVFADQPANTQQQSQPTAPNTSTVQESPEERAYKAKQAQLAKKIAEKIVEVQNKQKEIDSEIYPAEVPPLREDKKVLLQQLNELQMQQTEMESQKTYQDWEKKMRTPQGGAQK